MNDYWSEVPRECNFPQCDEEAEHIETSLLMMMCTPHMELISARLEPLVDGGFQWRSLSEPLDDLDPRKAIAALEHTILRVASLKTTN